MHCCVFALNNGYANAPKCYVIREPPVPGHCVWNYGHSLLLGISYYRIPQRTEAAERL